ncbi:hypothetical protein EAO06_01285 [Klebsiella pneumoniae]|nr:hypothetical protein EAO06_01285 [Klebsiella pneumoniae]
MNISGRHGWAFFVQVLVLSKVGLVDRVVLTSGMIWASMIRFGVRAAGGGGSIEPGAIRQPETMTITFRACTNTGATANCAATI